MRVTTWQFDIKWGAVLFILFIAFIVTVANFFSFFQKSINAFAISVIIVVLFLGGVFLKKTEYSGKAS